MTERCKNGILILPKAKATQKYAQFKRSRSTYDTIFAPTRQGRSAPPTAVAGAAASALQSKNIRSLPINCPFYRKFLTEPHFKENIIVKSPQISYTYSFALSVQSLTAELQETGEIVFRDIHTNEIKYHIPAPYMYDSLGSVSHDVEYSLETVSNGYVITITADSSWLNNAERAFPVTIDPTIQKAIVFDTFISSANPTENYGSSSELWISPSRISF